jgi:hypothetical protein
MGLIDVPDSGDLGRISLFGFRRVDFGKGLASGHFSLDFMIAAEKWKSAKSLNIGRREGMDTAKLEILIGELPA